MKTASVTVHIADLREMRAFISAVADLLRALGQCEELPEPVMTAADDIRRSLVRLGGIDIGPPP